MNTYGSTNRSNILGLLDDDFEKESFLSSAVKSIGSVVEDTISLVRDEVAESVSVTEIPKAFVDAFKNESADKLDPTKFPSKGSIEFKNQAKQLEQLQKEQQDQKEANRKKDFFQALKDNAERAQRAKDRILFEEEINDIATNLPTDQKNELLHYQASYKDRSIYQRAELRKKLIEEQKKSENQQKAASIPSPAKQPSAMEGAFEGRSGSQGGGTANLSAQAVG